MVAARFFLFSAAAGFLLGALAFHVPAGGSATLLAQVGVSAGVPPNPYNTLAEELRKKEETLHAEEARVRVLALPSAAPSDLRSFWLSAGGWLALLMLIGLNYVLDIRRARGAAQIQP